MVKELMGHKHIAMTLRYAHLAPGHKRSAVEVLEQSVGKSPSNFHNSPAMEIDARTVVCEIPSWRASPNW